MAGSNKFSIAELFFLVLAILFIPCIFMQQGFLYFTRQQHARIIESATLELQKPIKELNTYKDNESFWCQTLSHEFRQSLVYPDFASRVEKLSRITMEPLQYVIWKNNGKVIKSNFIAEQEWGNWKGLIDDLKTARFFRNLTERNIAEKRIRKLLGPHYFGEDYLYPSSSKSPRLIKPDSAGQRKLIWLNFSSKFDAMVFFDQSVLNRNSRLKLFFHRWQENRQNLLFLTSKNITRLRDRNAPNFRSAFYEHLKNGKEIFRFNNLMLAITATGKSECVVYFKEFRGLENNSSKLAVFICLLISFCILILMRSGYISLKPGDVSIRSQLLLLLFISAGIPMMSLGLIALEHLQQKHEHLIKKAYQRCIEYIQVVDRRGETELSQVLLKSAAAMKEFKKLFNSGSSAFETVSKSTALLHMSFTDFRAVASTGNLLLSKNGFLQNGSFHMFTELSQPFRDSQTPQELRVLNDLASYYLTFLNRGEIDPKRFTEIELLTEMFYQKSLAEIMHDLVWLNSLIAQMGWGGKAFPVFGSTISLNNASATQDFFVLMAHSPQTIAKAYFYRQADNLLRNQMGLRIFLTNGGFIFPGDTHIFENPELADIFSQISSHPSAEPKFADFDGQKWIFAGLQAQFLDSMKIMALSPMSQIEEDIAGERYFILYSGLAAFLILLSVTLLFGHSFMFPLRQLQLAASAVEKREPGFQLPVLSNDEFGNMGKIFNKSISELEELAIASIVQGRLMPAHTIDAGKFDVFGKSVPMADLGGDYFDYFVTDNDHFAVLLGDVAGHGVGASLIMAMAKAGIICSANNFAEPAKILGNLHQMICSTRSKNQRKIMTFQYLYLDKQSGSGKYANAGGCSPILVSPESGKAEEITLTGPVLGGFKNSKFSDIPVSLADGEALVFYTDGIIEVQNPAGEELGYERFKEILLKNYTGNARSYYEAVFAAYLVWLGGRQPQDDLTLIMIVKSGGELSRQS